MAGWKECWPKAIVKRRSWGKSEALKALATGSNTDSKTSYLNLQRKSLFLCVCLYDKNPEKNI